MRIVAPGVTLELPPGWEAEVDAGSGEPEPELETAHTPRIHIANFALPPVRGDFGSGAVEAMSGRDVLICLLEESSASVGSPLFEQTGMPTVREGDFSPQSMQRPLPGQSGAQVFFSVAGRAFVLYVVLGNHATRGARIGEINQVLGGVRYDAS